MRGIDLEAIRQRAEAATPGPWRWRGNVDSHSMYLAGRDPVWGITTVMDFQRWGMREAQPVFCVAGLLHKATEFPVFEVCPTATTRDDPRVYRGDLIALRHPDAEFIAGARQDITDLLAYIEQLQRAVSEL